VAAVAVAAAAANSAMRSLAMAGRGSIAQCVFATLVAFGFLGLSMRFRSFKKPALNFVKLFAEFQIFCVLLICIVLHMGAIGLEHERIGAESYGLSLVIVTAAIIPISLVFVISSLHDIYLENKQGESTFDTFENELASK
jgi:hypothetical protein